MRCFPAKPLALHSLRGLQYLKSLELDVTSRGSISDLVTRSGLFHPLQPDFAPPTDLDARSKLW